MKKSIFIALLAMFFLSTVYGTSDIDCMLEKKVETEDCQKFLKNNEGGGKGSFHKFCVAISTLYLGSLSYSLALMANETYLDYSLNSADKMNYYTLYLGFLAINSCVVRKLLK